MEMVSGALKKAIVREISQRFPRLWLERELRWRPNHFERELWLVSKLSDNASTSIDVGANMGTYSYYMKKFSKKVIVFEPNTDLWPHLRRLLGSDCQFECVALSAQCSSSTLRIDPGNTGVSTIEEKNDLSCVVEKSAMTSRIVETRTLDSYEFSNVSLIKIDVEGHEEAVVAGAH